MQVFVAVCCPHTIATHLPQTATVPRARWVLLQTGSCFHCLHRTKHKLEALQTRTCSYTCLILCCHVAEELAALPAGAAEHNRAGTGVKCACGEDCELEIEPKQLQATLLEQYAAAVKQMKQRGSCKSWRFDQDTPKFTSTHAFRCVIFNTLRVPSNP